jgi:hypothetical protein
LADAKKLISKVRAFKSGMGIKSQTGTFYNIKLKNNQRKFTTLFLLPEIWHLINLLAIYSIFEKNHHYSDFIGYISYGLFTALGFMMMKFRKKVNCLSAIIFLALFMITRMSFSIYGRNLINYTFDFMNLSRLVVTGLIFLQSLLFGRIFVNITALLAVIGNCVLYIVLLCSYYGISFIGYLYMFALIPWAMLYTSRLIALIQVQIYDSPEKFTLKDLVVFAAWLPFQATYRTWLDLVIYSIKVA